jgi:hypothetical protein
MIEDEEERGITPYRDRRGGIEEMGRRCCGIRRRCRHFGMFWLEGSLSAWNAWNASNASNASKNTRARGFAGESNAIDNATNK